jgi:hypothetical protein
VGVGKVTQSVQPAQEFKVDVDGEKVSILQPGLVATNMDHHAGDTDRCEYLVGIQWEKAHPRDDAFWEAGLFANQNTAAKLRDINTIRRLEEHFGVAEEG